MTHVLQISDRWADSVHHVVGGSLTEMETLGAEARKVGFTTKLIKLSSVEAARAFLAANK